MRVEASIKAIERVFIVILERKYMKKKLIIGLIGCILTFSLVGCIEETTLSVNVENKSELTGDFLGKDALVYIGNDLYYDSTTRIVYMKCSSAYAHSYSVYYAPNGLPYRYNPKTNTFEEIENIN